MIEQDRRKRGDVEDRNISKLQLRHKTTDTAEISNLY